MRHQQIVQILSILVFSLFSFHGSTAQAQTADEIIERMLKRPAFGWDEAESTVRMTLVDKKGSKKTRVMENLRRSKNGSQQSVVRFRAPAEVAGTAFLMIEKKNGESEQHIYLPRLKRTRRIVGREREGSFMGSDFTYADMERGDTRASNHKRLKDEKISGIDCYVIESTPKNSKDATYSKIESWVRKDNSIPLRVRYYDKDGKLLKTLYTKRIKDMDGNPVVVEVEMINNQTEHRTHFVVDDMRKRKDIPDTAFTPTALEHG